MEAAWDEVIEGGERLLELLEQQAGALRDRDPEQVGRIAAQMGPLIEHLEHAGRALEGARATLAEPLHGRLVRLLHQCRRSNADNGARIAALARHQRRALALLCADPGGARVYGPQGDQRGIRLSRYTARA